MMNDCVGKEVHVGDVITYPGRASSHLYVNTGIIKEFVERRRNTGYNLKVERVGRNFCWDEEQRKSRWITTTKLVTVYETDRITLTTLTPEELYAYYEGISTWR